MAEDVLRFVRADLRSMTRYNGVDTLERVAAEVGLPVEQLVKLNANENVYGLDEEVKKAITAGAHCYYPDPQQTDIRQAIAALHEVHPDNVVAGAGSDDLLDILLRMANPKCVIISTPTFGMYSFLGKVLGTTVLDVPRKENFDIDLPAILQAVRENPESLVFLPSPNNPTGNVLSNEDALAILAENCLLVIDEAYAEFNDHSAISLLAAHPNLIVTRTFSKWAGLAGVRLGYALACTTLTDYMMAIKQPYNVNSAADAAGCAALRRRAEIMKSVAAIRAEKDVLFQELSKFPFLEPVPSSANFILMKVVEGRSAKGLHDYLRSKGILIRYFGAQGGNLHNYVRISAGKPEHTTALVAALAAWNP